MRWTRAPRIRRVLLFLVAILLVSCTRRENRAIDPLLAGFPEREIAVSLTAGNDSALAQAVRDAGYDATDDFLWTVGRESIKAWRHGDDRRYERACAYTRHLSSVFAIVFHDSSHARRNAFLDRLPPEQQARDLRFRTKMIDTQDQPPASAPERIAAYAALLQSFLAAGDETWAAACKWLLAFEEESRGDDEAMMRLLRESCSDFERLGMTKMSCQALGTLGGKYEKEGKIDSMFVCFERARRISNRSRMGYQGARILTFYAGYYRRIGRLELERLFLNRAIDVARRYNAGWYEVRFVRENMTFHANLGCWDVVETLLQRVRALERKCKGRVLGWSEIELLRVDVLEARLRMQRGDVAGADELFDRVRRRLPELGLSHAYRAEDDEISLYRAEGLLANGRPREALDEVRKTLEQPVSESTDFWLARTALFAAKVSLELGDASAAEALLGTFDRYGETDRSDLRAEWTERDAILGTIRLRRGDVEGARAALEEGLRRLEGSLAEMDAGVASYLMLFECGELRRLMHDVTSADTALGYGGELYWNGLYATLGLNRRLAPSRTPLDARPRPANTQPGDKPTIEGFRVRAQEALAGLSRLGAVHSVYFNRDDVIWRWTASRKGIRRDILDVRPSELDSLVKETIAGMSAGTVAGARTGDAPLPRRLREDLGVLARRFLPDEVRLATETGSIFFVTADGPLSHLPFESFDVGTGAAYDPVLAHWDVAYLRFPSQTRRALSPGPGVVLLTTDPKRGHGSGLSPRGTLGYAAVEGDALTARDPRAVSLGGGPVTKSRVMSLWENAPYIYIAGHTDIAPDAPYLASISVGAPSDSAPDVTQIDIADIRAADLGGCGLVVLSGCSSGTPYLRPETEGPSLGDAFLDAGAGAIIQTFWDVTDEDAMRIMTSFIRRWRDAPAPGGQRPSTASLIHEFCDARRGECRGPKGIRHPSYWASFSIEVSAF